jgi:hypothetical protein
MRACYKEAVAFSSAFADTPTEKTVRSRLRGKKARPRGERFLTDQ